MQSPNYAMKFKVTNMKKFLILSIIFALNFCLSAAEFFSGKLDSDSLLAFRYANQAKEHFSLNNDKIQINGKNSTLSAAWAGHNIIPSKNEIIFSLQSLSGKNQKVKLVVTLYPWHVDPADMCNGKAEETYFKAKRFFFFELSAAPNAKTIKFPLNITKDNLKCEQCGKILDHVTFLLHFELLDECKIEISPFEIHSAFPIKIQQKTDKHSEYLSNVTRSDYTPYPQKELSEHPVLTDDVLTLSQKAMATRKNLSMFRPVLDLYQKGNFAEAVALAETLDKENTFASIFLYLMYSRGYNGIAIDNQKAGKYFSNFIGSYMWKEPGFTCYIFDYKNIWKKYRLTPTFPDEKVTISAWSSQNTVMNEIIPLRGKYLLRECYEEKMQNIGGVGARTLYLIGREQFALGDLLEEAKNLGSAEAWVGFEFAPFEYRGINPERTPLEKETTNHPTQTEFTNLEKAAELGYVPAKITLAKTLVTPNFKHAEFDSERARKLLIEVIAECSKYEKIGCKHALTDLKYAKALLAIIPTADTSSEKLNKMYEKLLQDRAKAFDHNFINFQLSILKNILNKRNDNPESLFFQAESIPNHKWQEKNAAMLKAAEAGSKQATSYCLSRMFGDRSYWKILILAGKHKLPYNGSYGSFFNEAYKKIRELKYQLPPPEYQKMLIELAPYHKEAKAELDKLNQNGKLNFEFISNDNLTVKCQFLPNGGQPMIKINAEPSEFKRHITIKRNGQKNLRGGIFMHSTSKQLSNLDLYGEFINENGQSIKTYVGNNPPIKYIPTELKITIAPRETHLDLQINFFIYQ